MSADDDECALKTDTCGVLGPDWICRNTLGSFRCDKKRCTGPNCRVLQGGFNNTNQSNRSSVKCLRGYETDQNNKCTGNYCTFFKYIFYLFLVVRGDTFCCIVVSHYNLFGPYWYIKWSEWITFFFNKQQFYYLQGLKISYFGYQVLCKLRYLSIDSKQCRNFVETSLSINVVIYYYRILMQIERFYLFM